MTQPTRPSRWRRRCWWLLPLVTAAVLLGDFALYSRCTGIGGRSFDKGQNGLWLRYSWYFGEMGNDEVVGLAKRLRQRQIGYAYFHVRDVTDEGKLRFRKPETARRLVEVMHREAPGVEVIAWVYAGNRRGLGKVDLADPQVRENMVAEARWLLEECDFDGVQWDYEVCPDGDPYFLSLMRETREALPEGAILSTATPVWAPEPFVRRWGWNEEYFSQVAGTCDQVAVMCYDTGVYLPRVYVWLVRQQAIHVTRAVARGNPECGIILGVPTYAKGGRAHHPRAENLRLALKGVREGLASGGADTSVFEGIAPFADYTTDPAEWQTYDRLWLGDDGDL